MIFGVFKDRQRQFLVVITSIIVSYVRGYLQYDRYMWISFTNFLGSFVINFFSIYLLILFVYFLIHCFGRFFIEDTYDGEKAKSWEIDSDEVLVCVCFTLIALSVSIFMFGHYEPNDPDYFDQLF